MAEKTPRGKETVNFVRLLSEAKPPVRADFTAPFDGPEEAYVDKWE